MQENEQKKKKKGEKEVPEVNKKSKENEKKVHNIEELEKGKKRGEGLDPKWQGDEGVRGAPPVWTGTSPFSYGKGCLITMTFSGDVKKRRKKKYSRRFFFSFTHVPFLSVSHSLCHSLSHAFSFSLPTPLFLCLCVFDCLSVPRSLFTKYGTDMKTILQNE